MFGEEGGITAQLVAPIVPMEVGRIEWQVSDAPPATIGEPATVQQQQ